MAVDLDSVAPSELHQLGVPALAAEGESASGVDLVRFAQLIADSDAELYCADWASTCAQQLAIFEDGANSLPYIEVGTPDRRGNSIAAELGLTTVPTWILPNSQRIEGVVSLDELAMALEIAIPQGETPHLEPLEDVIVASRSPLHVGLDAFDPGGENLTFHVEVANPSLISASVLDGNRSLRLQMDDFGEMVFELFEQRAPRPSGQIAQLAESGFYDGVIFHRVFNDFVIQGGDPTGSGGGGSSLGPIDDQYHLELQHNTTGVLSYAKSTDDTGDSQFFITEGPQRHLDFNHAIFGLLVEGEQVREAISRTATVGSRPLFDIPIASAGVFTDNENGVLLIRPMGDATGETSVTVRATDASGNFAVRTFNVTVQPDTVNTPPFLQDISDQFSPNGTPASFQLQGVDREGDALVYSVEVASADPAVAGITAMVDSQGLVTVQSSEDYLGTVEVRVSVEQAEGTPSGQGDREDAQTLLVTFFPAHQNQVAPLDVNNDGFVTPQDVLQIVNFLNGDSDGNSTIGQPPAPPYRDVNGDLFITPIDVLLVVNHLNSAGEGAGESDRNGVAVDWAIERLSVDLSTDLLIGRKEQNKLPW